MDRFLVQRIPTTDRALVRVAFTENAVRINGRRALKGAKVQPGDIVEVSRLFETSDRRVLPDPSMTVRVIHADEALIVFDKPAGMPVHPLRIGELGTLANAMVARFPETGLIGPDPMFPALLHRIDADTSGLVLAARTQEAYTNLRRQFKARQVVKEYTAVVHGAPDSPGRLVHFLAHDPKQPGRMLAELAVPRGAHRRWMKAITDYVVLKAGRHFSLLHVTIRTGVTHQIRCQLAAAGYPIVGDVVYGESPDRTRFNLSRHCLHACAISILHPTRGRMVRFESPAPEEWESFLSVT